MLEFGAVLLDRFDHRHEFGADEDDFAAGIVEDVDDLRSRQAPVDADEHDVGLERAQQHLKEDVGVHAHVGDAGLGLGAQRDQTVGDLARVLVEGGVGGLAALEMKRRRVPALLSLLARNVGEHFEPGEIVHVRSPKT